MVTQSEPVLAAEEVRKRFGGIQAVGGVSLELAPGEILGMIGPNGSGKTTMINLLTGVCRPDAGRVLLGGTDVTGKPAHALVPLGLARTFQNPRVFKTMTVRQNLLVSVSHRSSVSSLRGLGSEVDEWLELVGLREHADRVAHELSGGQQKLVEFARAMVHRPRVVLMDEPFAGVHPHVKATLHDRITELTEAGKAAFLVVSHEVPDLVALSHRFLCMAGGERLAVGTPDAVCADPRVVDAYLGAPLEKGAAQ